MNLIEGAREVLEQHREIDHGGEDVPYWKNCSCGASSVNYVDHVAMAMAGVMQQWLDETEDEE